MGIKLHPIWKQAVVDLLEMNPEPGYVITEDWLLEHFELPRPSGGGFDAAEKWRFTFLDLRTKFKEALEDEHSLIFTDVERKSGGMRLLYPHEVAEYEEKRWRSRVGNETRRTVRRLKNTNLLDMTPDQREKHLLSLARRQWQAKLLRESQKQEVPQKFFAPGLPKLQLKKDPPDEEEAIS